MRTRTSSPVRRPLDGPTSAGCSVALEQVPAAVADLASVRCLDVPTSGAGHPGVGTPGPRLAAVAGERAAGDERAPDSWEYVMPWQVRSEQERRLVAGGYGVRVLPRSRPGDAAPAGRRPVGRS